MKWRKPVSLSVFAAVLMLGCGNDSPVEVTGGSENGNALTGRILHENGEIAAGVTVKVVPVSNNPKASGAAYLTGKTDGNGEYCFSGVNPGAYNIEGVKDSAGVLIDSVGVAGETRAPDGYLGRLGVIKGTVHMSGLSDTDQVRIDIYMPGTLRSTNPTVGGAFAFNYVPAADYAIYFVPFLGDFPVTILDTVLNAGDTLDLDTIHFGTREQDTVDIKYTAVSGVWKTGGVYRIFNDITVSAGASLTIEPGVTVMFMGDFALKVGGDLQAHGTADSLIVFTCGYESGHWEEIDAFYAEKVGISYAIIEKADFGVKLKTSNYDNSIHNCVFRYNSYYGINILLGCMGCMNTDRNFAVYNNVFHDINADSTESSAIRFFDYGTGAYSIRLVNNIVLNCRYGVLVRRNATDSDAVNLQVSNSCNYNNGNDFVRSYLTARTPFTPKELSSMVSSEPLFAGLTKGSEDYHLSVNSPCKATGYGNSEMGIYSAMDEEDILRMLDLPVVDAGSDTTVSIKDTVDLHGLAVDSAGNIVFMAWKVGETGSFVPGSSGDTSICAPDTADSNLTCVFMAMDNDSHVVYDTMVVTVLRDAPKAYAGLDSLVLINTSVSLHGRATDGFGRIVKWEWDIGNTGGFVQTSSGDTGFSAPPQRNPDFQCVLRVTDDDGNADADTVRFLVAGDSLVEMFDVSVENITTSSVSVAWMTNLAASQEVLYGTDVSLGMSQPAAGYGLLHRINLTGLSSDTRYYFRVVSGNGVSGDTSGLRSFTTRLTRPSTIRILKLPAGSAPALDGSLTEWPAEYLVATISGDENVFARNASAGLDPATEWNGELYAACDGDRVYFAVKVTSDDAVIGSGAEVYDADNLKVNPGGSAMAFYIGMDNRVKANPSCPYTLGTTLFAVADAVSDNGLPVYEFSLSSSVLDPFGMGTFQLSVGTEDQDDNGRTDMHFLGFGTYYTGNKLDWSGNAWDNPSFYPTFNLLNDLGPDFRR